MPGPRSPDYYKLPGCRLFYGVDYGRYMFALAREIGAIPNLWSWSLKNPRVAFASAFLAATPCGGTCSNLAEHKGKSRKRPLLVDSGILRSLGLGALVRRSKSECGYFLVI